MNSRPSSLLTAQASAAFRRGDYAAALAIYKTLSDRMGGKLFSVNILLCQKKIGNNSSESARFENINQPSPREKNSLTHAKSSENFYPYSNPGENKSKQSIAPLKAIAILDEISEECWKYELNHFRISRHNYSKQINVSTADFAFLESCWKGNGGAWEYAFTSAGLKHANAQALLELIQRLKARKMPIVFWNKEDPMHYERYLPIAKKADIIFTTDSSKIDDYQRDTPNAKVYELLFAAQPKICNPSNRSLAEAGTVCFAGSYYSVGHEARKQQMHALLPSIIEYKGAIYDRFSKVGDNRYRFPEQYQPFIRDAVSFRDVVKLYKRFKVFLNVNTITSSPTMMSRRVYELLACGTPVVSTPSKAIEAQFPGIVQTANDANEANSIIEKLLADNFYWDKISHIGYREVMTKHTYADRMLSIRHALGIEENKYVPLVSIVTCTNRPFLVDRIVDNVARQKHSRCELILMLQGFSRAQKDELLNKIKQRRSDMVNIELLTEDCPEISLGERFNQAAQFANGDYIAKMDDDDLYLENYLSDMLIPFGFGDFAIVGKRELFMYLSGTDKLVKRYPGMRHASVDFVAGPTLLIKKTVFDQIRFEPRNTGEDTSFIKNVLNAGYKIYATDPFNFVQVRSSNADRHTWKISDYEILQGKQTEVVANGLDLEYVSF